MLNVDLYTGRYNRRGSLDVHGIPNFVRADASSLPFKEIAFESVIASHVLEHVKYPFETLKEWKRVASRRVIVTVPSLSSAVFMHKECEYHLHSWSKSSLESFMRLVFQRITVSFNPRPMKWYWKGTIPTIVNFIIHNFLSYLAVFQNAELIAIGTIE